jgi:PAS domain S-box-containing protein
MFLEKCFDLIAQNINEALLGIDESGKLIIANNRAEELLSINLKEDMGKYIEDVIPETKLNKILKTGRNELNKSFFANNREFITSRLPVIIDGKIKGAITIFEDITNNKKMQQKLIDNEIYIDILNTIINALNECLVLVDEQGL